jgi:flagellar basal-body rod protein FlgF
MGETGAIRVPAGALSISPDGPLSVNGAVAGKIRLAEFPPETKLISEGGSLVAAPDGSAQAAARSAIRQGTLESSNVNGVSAVVTLIGVQRQAEMLERAMSLFHGEFNRIASQELPRV